MNLGPAPWTSNPAEQECTEQEIEREENLSDSAAVSSQCTEVQYVVQTSQLVLVQKYA